MNIVGGVLVTIHVLSWAFVLGATAVSIRSGVIPKGTVHAALTALVTGLVVAVLMASGALGWGEPVWPKMLLKLAVTLVICALAWWGGRKEKAGSALVGTVTALNVAIAVIWHT